MKFSSIVSALAFASTSLGSAVLLEKKQTTPVSAITNILTDTHTAVELYYNAIGSAAATARKSVNATVVVQAEAAINADYAAVVNALLNAASSIEAVTGNTTAAITAQATGLTQAEVDQLAADIQTVVEILAGLNATIAVTASDLTPDAEAAVSAETTAVEKAIEPFVGPIAAFARAVESASASATVTVRGVANALVGLNTIVQRLVISFGLPPIAITS